MLPHLVALDGEQQGSIFPISDQQVIIVRDASNSIVFPISRLRANIALYRKLLSLHKSSMESKKKVARSAMEQSKGEDQQASGFWECTQII
jgi:hypothetical protein